MDSIKTTLKVYFDHIRPYKWRAFFIYFLLPFNVLAEDFVAVFVTAQILNQITEGVATWQSIQPLIFLMIAAEVYSIIFWRVAVWHVWQLEKRVLNDLADTAHKYYMHQSYDFHSNKFGGALVSQATKFINAYIRLFDEIYFVLFRAVVVSIATIIILLPIAPIFVLGLVSGIALYLLLLVKLKLPELALNQEYASLESDRTAAIADSITNVMTVKSYASERYESKRFGKVLTNIWNKTQQMALLNTRNEAIVGSIIRGINAFGIIIAAWLVINGKTEVGTIVLITGYTSTLMSRMWQVNFSFKHINRGFGDARDMVEMLEHEDLAIKDVENPEKVAIKNGKINFSNTDFSYEQKTKGLFKGLDLEIAAGSSVGLVGPSGGGKTTITKLLLRYVDVSGGKILIDGQDISKISQKDLRSKIAYVPQEPLLFHRSIKENIAYGKMNATEKEILTAAKRARVDHFVKDLPKGYSTLVGERGVKLSGGEKQRVAVARAMLKDAPLLILDEATSALDSESEVLIQEALTELMKNKTAIVIAHRLSTIQKLDRIVVLAEGSVIEDGTHNELLKEKGLYSELWSHQSGGFIED